MANLKKQPDALDIGQVNALSEPITVSVVKLRGSIPQPIDLFSKTDEAGNPYPPGTQYSREDIQLVQQWCFDKWGGGIYHGDAVDANGVKMKWVFGLPPAHVPEKVPPEVAARMNASTSVPVSGSVPMGTMGGGFGSYAPQVPILQPGIPNGQQYQQQQPQQQPFQPSYPNQYFGTQARGMDRERERDDTRLKQVEDMLQREREERIRLEHAATLEKQQSQHAADMAAMRDELRRLSEQRQQPVAPVDDGRIAKLEAELQKTREEGQRRLEMDQAERRHREEMQLLRDEMRAMRESTQNKGPDPFLEYMKENSRIQGESARAQLELARAQIVSPFQIAEMITKKGDGAAEMIRGFTDSFQGLMAIQSKVVENITNLSGSGQQHPAIEILQNGIEQGAALGKQYFAMQKEKTIAEARGKAQEAQALAQAEGLRAQAAFFTANPGKGIPQVAAQQTPAQVAAPNGTTAPAANGGGTLNGAPKNSAEAHEAQIFGPLYESVQNLRTGVRSNKLDAEMVVDAVIGGVDAIKENKLEVPAFRLFAEDRFPELIDLLLPLSPAAFKESVVKRLVARLNGESPPDDEEPETDDDTEDEGGGEVQEEVEAIVATN